MDRLILLRHAKAEADAPSGDDFDRPLAPRGVREARTIAEQLATLGYRPDVILVSPALRTRQTWEALNEAMPGAEARFDRALYSADGPGVRRLAEQAGEGRGTVLVVGHNPGLHELVARLIAEAGGPATFLARVRKGFPPAAAAVFDIDADGRPSPDGLFYPERGG